MASNKVNRRHLPQLILPRQLSNKFDVEKKSGPTSPSNRSAISFFDNQHNLKPSASASLRSRGGTVSDAPTNPSDNDDDDDDDDDDNDDNISNRWNYRFAPRLIRIRRRSSNYSIAHQQRARVFGKSDVVVSPTTIARATTATLMTTPYHNLRGQTLLHLAARLGHDKILRLLICETSQASILMDNQGETPLLTAIKAGSTSTATLLMESDPRSIIVSDDKGSSVFHYACEYCNDVILNRAIAFLKRLSSTSDRMIGLRRITERNYSGQTAFDIAIAKGQLKCVKQFLLSSWLDATINIQELINATSLKNAIDHDQFDILSFLVTDIRRFAGIIHLLIDTNGQYFNLLEYAIYRKKKDIIRLFISVRIPLEEVKFRQEYKLFLQHYNEPFAGSSSVSFYQTPIQRMLMTPECVSLVPLILEQFVDNHGIDLSIIDDALCARPMKNRCIFGQNKQFSAASWLQQHPLTLIATADSKDIYDHQLVRMCVDLKFNLFGNFLYFLILCCQSIYVALYTGIALGSPTPANQGTSYYNMVNYSCIDLCLTLTNDPTNPATDQPFLRAIRLILLIISGIAILKEFYQVFTQKEKYFRRFYINLIELHMYISAIIYSVDMNECTRQTGIRCSTQWMAGGIGLLSVWTSLLLVVMNGIKFGKHGLLLITVFVTFLKLIAVYIFIWIGYILAFYMICKDILDQFRFFNFIPKLLVMFIGEYDMDTLFFPVNNQLLPGAEAALILYSAYIFTMFIVMSNIMGGLAVAEVKQFRLNAKREHLRSRIGVVLGFQTYFGGLCGTISSIMMRLCKNKKWLHFLERFNLMPMKYQIENLEIRSQPVNISRSLITSHYSTLVTGAQTEQSFVHPSLLPTTDAHDQVYIETGFYMHRRTVQDDSIFKEDENIRLARKTDELRDSIEESTVRTNIELRKIALDLQNELEDIKRRLMGQKS